MRILPVVVLIFFSLNLSSALAAVDKAENYIYYPYREAGGETSDPINTSLINVFRAHRLFTHGAAWNQRKTGMTFLLLNRTLPT